MLSVIPVVYQQTPVVFKDVKAANKVTCFVLAEEAAATTWAKCPV
jgi:hypothetical protein